MHLESLHPYNYRHGKENPKIIGFELYSPDSAKPRPCFKVVYESDNVIDYVAHESVVDKHWKIKV